MEFVALSDNLKPLSVRFPGLFGESNQVFQVSLSRQPFSETEGDLANTDSDNKVVDDAFKQVNYPISHCIEHQDKPGSAFRNARVLYIETGKMEVSNRLAKQIMKRQWMQEWLKLPGREVIIAAVIAGHIQKIDQAA